MTAARSTGGCRVLSIQSHVVHGYVGNKCAAFILQLHGHDVDLINSVQLSNHTGYNIFGGCELTVSTLNSIFESLKSNGLTDSYDWLISGYMKSAAFIREVVTIARFLKENNPSMLYICDPVMGDDGKMYVHEDSVDVYTNELIKLADILTPNYYEFELMTDSVDQMLSLDQIAQKLKLGGSFRQSLIHAKGPKYVVITSIGHLDPHNLILMGSRKLSGDHGTNAIKWFKISIPRIDVKFTGTGDVFSSLLLHYMSRPNSRFYNACKMAVLGLRKILVATMSYERNKNLSCVKELRLVQNRKELESMDDADDDGSDLAAAFGLDRLEDEEEHECC